MGGREAEERSAPRDGAAAGGGCGAVERPELRIVLLGRSGAGRSATGNTLLGRVCFQSRLASQPVTRTCAQGTRCWDGWDVVVMDTPAIFGGSRWEQEHLAEERRRCVEFASRQPCALLLVTQLGRYTREDREVLEGVREAFGKAAMKRTMVVFTRQEDLGGSSLRDYVQTAENKAFWKLVQACGQQYCAVSNTEPGPQRDAQAEEVLRMALSIASGQRVPEQRPRRSQKQRFCCW